MVVCIDCGAVLDEQNLIGTGYGEKGFFVLRTGYVVGRAPKTCRLSYKERREKRIKDFVKDLVIRLGVDYSVNMIYNLFEKVNKKMKIGYAAKARSVVAMLVLYLCRADGKAVLFSDVFTEATQTTEKLGRVYRQLKNMLVQPFLSFNEKTNSCEVSLIQRLIEELSLVFEINKEATKKESSRLHTKLMKDSRFSGCKRSPLVAACVFLGLSTTKYKMTKILKFIEERTRISSKTAAKRVYEIRRSEVATKT